MLALYNGKIYAKNKFYEAMVIQDKQIKFIGNNGEAERLLDEGSQKIDLKDRLVLPGFTDSHAHGGYSTALAVNRINLGESQTVAEYQKIIKEFILQHPDLKFIQGIGWSSPLFEEEGPPKELLDYICSDRPVVLKSAEGHAVWANSKAIRLAGVTEETAAPKGGVIEKNKDGSVRGCFKEEAQKLIDAITPEISVADYKKAILQYQQFMAKYGYTAAAEMLVEMDSNLHQAYRELAEENKLLIKAELGWLVNPCGAKEATEKFKNRVPVFHNKLIDGYYAKLFIDGVVENGTAWLKEPYADNPDYCGEALWEDDRLFDTCTALDNLGYDLHFHVIGDAAVKQMADAMEVVHQRNGHKTRHTVAAHMQLADKEDIMRLKQLDILVSADPFWFFKDKMYYEGIEFPLLGRRADSQYPMKSLMDEGIVVSSASDYSVTPEPDPIMAIYLGMKRAMPAQTGEAGVLNEKECVDLKRMVDTVTVNGAITMNINAFTGSLTPGKLADLVILDQNIFKIPHEKLNKTEVVMTMSEGKIIYKNPKIRFADSVAPNEGGCPVKKEEQ